MPDTPVQVTVIIGSTRANRFAPVVAHWIAGEASARADLEVDLVDLADVSLPERLGDFDDPKVADVSALGRRLGAADAFVIVTPEYNHSVPGALKNAIDWFNSEWRAKPVAFVSYGGQAGGLRAVEHLRQIFAELHAVGLRETVSFPGVFDAFDENGRPRDTQGTGQAAEVMLDDLVWWGRALSRARAEQPYPAPA